jgi:hypothetical protein
MDPAFAEWQFLDMRISRLLKGRNRAQQARVYVFPGDAEEDLARRVAGRGAPVVAFLLRDDAQVARTFLTDASQEAPSLVLADRETVQAMRCEVREQEQIARNLGWARAFRATASYARVGQGTRLLGSGETCGSAVDDLLAMGRSAVPPMILMMNDRTRFGCGSLTLPNPPGMIERDRHYAPKQVVDAVAALLNHQTGENLGGIHNGGTEAARGRTVAAWRVYLYRNRQAYGLQDDGRLDQCRDAPR